MPDSLSKVDKEKPYPCFLPDLYKLLENRKYEGQAEQSYTAKLMQEGLDSILKKIGEETTELVLAAKNRDHHEQVHEISDLCYHLLVLMVYHRIPLDDIQFELKRRLGRSGIEEKKSRNFNMRKKHQ